MPCRKLSSVGRHAFRVAAPSVWNSLADYLHDPALELNSFRRQLDVHLRITYRQHLIYYDYALRKVTYLLTVGRVHSSGGRRWSWSSDRGQQARVRVGNGTNDG